MPCISNGVSVRRRGSNGGDGNGEGASRFIEAYNRPAKKLFSFFSHETTCRIGRSTRRDRNDKRDGAARKFCNIFRSVS